MCLVPKQNEKDIPKKEPVKPKTSVGLKMFRDQLSIEILNIFSVKWCINDFSKYNIENIKNVSESLPCESDAFQTFIDVIVVPLAGAGGQLGVFKVF